MASSSPMWAETSVRWLRTNHIEYVAASSKLPFPQQLAAALRRMAWRQFELVTTDGLSMREYANEITAASGGWREDDHKGMVDFIARGGYAALVATAELDAGTVDVAVIDDSGEIVGREAMGIVMDEINETDLEQLEQEMAPHSQPAPEHELQDFLEQTSLKEDDRFGAW